jgi:2-phospho-L-lactate guanylyltransferase
MKLCLIIPAKAFRKAKSRLSPRLSADERQQLSRNLFLHVLGVARQLQEAAQIIVVSPDPQVLAWAGKAGAYPLLEQRQSRHDDVPERSLNSALEQAAQLAVSNGADAVLVLPADLPLLTVGDVQLVIKHGEKHPAGMVIAPSQDYGTNAILLRPAGAIPFAFGPFSYWRHWRLAQEAGLPIEVVASPGLCHDLDNPRDLNRVADLASLLSMESVVGALTGYSKASAPQARR